VNDALPGKVVVTASSITTMEAWLKGCCHSSCTPTHVATHSAGSSKAATMACRDCGAVPKARAGSGAPAEGVSIGLARCWRLMDTWRQDSRDQIARTA